MILNISDRKRRKIYLGESQYGKLLEAEWNYHFTGNKNGFAGKGVHDMRPYMSDSKFSMAGGTRGTGHFGSGTYFSTYMKGDYSPGIDMSKYGDASGDYRSEFIKIGNGVYRVDLDFYKNLYRVRTKRQGDVLYTMMKKLNGFFNTICNDFAKFRSNTAYYGLAGVYQIIKRNAEGLGLKCPSYYQLTRMAQELGKNEDDRRSFSTVFMEWNGYNGVNVSGVDYYDNGRHGSVVYDLSKTDTTMEEINPMKLRLFTGLNSSTGEDNSIVMNGYDDPYGDSLRGVDLLWQRKLNDMPVPQAMRLLKNYTYSGHILDPFTIKDMNDVLAKRYLRIIYVNDPFIYRFSTIEREIMNGDYSEYYIKLINKYGAYYWANYEVDGYHKDSMLVKMLDNFKQNLSWRLSGEENRQAREDYLNKVMSFMTRELSDYEKEYIKDDYLYVRQ